MLKQDEYGRLIRAARELAESPVDEEDARRAIELVRRNLAGDRGGTADRRRVLWISGGIAAAAALAGSIAMLMVSLSPHPADAAEQLQAAAATTRDYKGWIHITPGSSTFASPIQGMFFSGIHVHINTSTGATAIEFRLLGVHSVEMMEPRDRRQLVYSGLSGELQSLPLEKDSADRMMAAMDDLPLKLADQLADMTSVGGPAPVVKESTDGNLQRFDITLPADPKTIPEKYRNMAAGTTTIWIDPQTQLIRREKSEVDGKPLVLEYSYGEPEIRDIYDLGVPRSAKVDEVRQAVDEIGAAAVRHLPDTRSLVKDSSQDTQAILDRIDKRRNSEFGDYVMIECQQNQGTAYQGHQEGRISLMAMQGDKAISEICEVAPEMAFFGWSGFPRGWPTPTLADALATIKRAVVVQTRVFNGNKMWEAEPLNFFGAGGTTKPATQPNGAQATVMRQALNLGWQFWPATNGPVNIKGWPGNFEFLHDPARPGLIVIHVKTSFPIGKGTTQPDYRSEGYYWIDPAHDDLTVESVENSNFISDMTTHSVCLDFGRLPDGRWYPSHWAQEAFNWATGSKNTNYTEHWRQVFPDAKLDQAWYGDPGKRTANPKWLFPGTRPAGNQ